MHPRWTSRCRWVPLLTLPILLIAAAQADTITAKMREEDPRLRRPVSLIVNGAYTAEILEQLRKQTGVSVRPLEESGAGDVKVTAVLTEVPLGDAMDALWSLLSYRHGRWHWWRRGKPGAYEYVLMRPREAQLLPARLQAWEQTEFERHAERMLAALDLTPEQRAAMASIDGLVPIIDQSRYNRGGLTAFRELLTPEQRLRVLRGERMTVPLANASDYVRQYAYREWEFATSYARSIPPEQRDPRRPIPPPPDSLTFVATRWPGDVGRVLFILVAGIGGYAYLGGGPFQTERRADLYEWWLQPGDLRRHVLGDRRLDTPSRSPDSPREPSDPEWRPMIAARLRELAKVARISFMARLDFADRDDPGAPDGGTVATYLERLANRRPYYQSKWRRGLLLVTYPTWYQLQVGTVDIPYAVVQELRKAREEHGGYLPVETIAQAVTRLSREQLLFLSSEFPELRSGAYWSDLFRLFATSPPAAAQLRSDRGLPIQQLGDALTRRADTALTSLLAAGRLAAVRLRDQQDANGRLLGFELIDAGGAVQWQSIIRYPRPGSQKAAGS